MALYKKPLSIVNGSEIYSTTEQIIGVYDNKTLYRKVISSLLPSAAGSVNIAHGLSSGFTIIDSYGVYMKDPETYSNYYTYNQFPLSNFFSNEAINVWINTIDSTNVTVTVGDNKSDHVAVITIEYIKD